MGEQAVLLQGGRRLILRSPREPLGPIESGPFAAMLPAFDRHDRDASTAVVAHLVDLGCIEFCCVGPEAEALHDAIIDWVIEDKNALHVVTTWHDNQTEGGEYFLYAAGGRPPVLLGLVADHPELVAVLQRVASAE